MGGKKKSVRDVIGGKIVFLRKKKIIRNDDDTRLRDKGEDWPTVYRCRVVSRGRNSVSRRDCIGWRACACKTDTTDKSSFPSVCSRRFDDDGNDDGCGLVLSTRALSVRSGSWCDLIGQRTPPVVARSPMRLYTNATYFASVQVEESSDILNRTRARARYRRFSQGRCSSSRPVELKRKKNVPLAISSKTPRTGPAVRDLINVNGITISFFFLL